MLRSISLKRLLSRFSPIRLLAFALACVLAFAPAPVGKAAGDPPVIRTLTAFVKMDPHTYRAELGEAATMLRLASRVFGAEGWTVESIRITTQPFPEYTARLSSREALAFLRELDDLATAGGYKLNIGPAQRRDSDDARPMQLLAELLANAQSTASSAHVTAGRRTPEIQWRVIRRAARLVQALKVRSEGSEANFNFAAVAMMPPYSPFYPASWHDGSGRRFAVGLQSANVVADVLKDTGYRPERAREALVAAMTPPLREVESIARRVEHKTGWRYMGIDTSPAPSVKTSTASVGDAIEGFTGRVVGSSGTATAAGLITSAIRSIPVRQVGFSGLMLPILEDVRLAERWGEGRLSLDALLSYSAVCGTGMDTVPLPGAIEEDQLVRIIGDVATLSVKWHKPLTARLLPIAGLKPGDKTDFENPLLANTVIQPLP